MTAIKRINTRAELTELARELKMRPDWHEPDEQEVTAVVNGANFDNAGFWGTEFEQERDGRYFSPSSVELYVTLCRDGEPVAEVCLATLFAFATGFEG